MKQKFTDFFYKLFSYEKVQWFLFNYRLKRQMETLHALEDPWSLQSDRQRIGQWFQNEFKDSSFKNALDVGAGEGHLLQTWLHHCEHMICLEVSKNALKKAQLAFSNENKISWKHSNAHMFFKKNHKFDLIILCYILDYLGYRDFTDRFVELFMKLAMSLKDQNSRIFIANPVYKQEDIDRMNQFDFLFRNFGLVADKKQIIKGEDYQIALMIFKKKPVLINPA